MRVGVFDIGTRATRLLVGDTTDGSFRYRNRGSLTHLGESFTSNNEISLSGFQKTVDTIREFISETGEEFGVQQYVGVATAALRRARNSEMVLDHLFQETGLKLQILEEEEEAYLSLLSVFCHFRSELMHERPIILIDQGGGSTEISCGRMSRDGYEFLGLESLELGTILLKNRFLSKRHRLINESYRETLDYIRDQLEQHKIFEGLEGQFPEHAFAMGSVITNLTGKKGNYKQNGSVITKERMSIALKNKVEFYQANDIKTIEDLLEEEVSNEALSKELLMIYGLPVYVGLLEKYHLNRLTVCGYGLRYGVFWYLMLRDSPAIHRNIPLELVSRDALTFFSSTSS